MSSLNPSTADSLGAVERRKADQHLGSASFDTVPSLGGLTDHTSGSEAHLPAATLETHDAVNTSALQTLPLNNDATLNSGAETSQPSANAPGGILNPGLNPVSASSTGASAGQQHAHVGYSPAVSLQQREALEQFPPPARGLDVRLSQHSSMLGQDLKDATAEMGAQFKAAVKAAPAQLKDTWNKLSSKTAEMKQQHFGGGAKVRSTEMKQQEGSSSSSSTTQ